MSTIELMPSAIVESRPDVSDFQLPTFVDGLRRFGYHAPLRVESYAPIEQRLGRKLTRGDHRQFFNEKISEHIASAAITAKCLSDNHRGAEVGSSFYAINEDDSYVVTLDAACFKQLPDGPKVCSERNAIYKLDRLACTYVVGFALAGPPQPDHHTGIIDLTLPPCGDCRELLVDSTIVDGQTSITTFDPVKRTRQDTIVHKLIARYSPELIPQLEQK
jgi:cytidine deaminase